MTKEYIERGALLELETFLKDTDGFECSAVLSVDIRHAKAADVVEVKHGRWKEQVTYICNSDDVPIVPIGLEYKCSECGRTENKQEPYCHCGAKMDGE